MALYNSIRYNESQYLYNLIVDTISLSEDISKDTQTALADTVFLSDDTSRNVTQKGLFDEIRTSDWISKNRSNNPDWSD